MPPAAVADRRHRDPHRPAGRRVAGRRRIAADGGRRRWSCARAASRSTPAASAPTSPSAARCRNCSRPSSGSRAGWRRRPRRTSADVEKQHPPVAVFEAFIKGLLAETPATAISYLRAALAGQPTFDRARLALWDVYAEQGEHALALAAVDVGAREDSPWFSRARFLAGLSQLNLKKYDDAFATFKALADARAVAGGAEQSRRRPAAARRRRAGRAAGVLLQQGRRSRSRRRGLPVQPRIRLLARARSAGGDLLAARGGAAQSRRRRRALRARAPRSAPAGNAAEATRERELARRLSRRYAPGKRPGGDAVPKGLERVKQEVELPHARQMGTRLASSEQRSNEELARFYLERGQRLFQQENDRDAIVELNRAIYLSPYLADAHLLLGRIAAADRTRPRSDRRVQDRAVERGDAPRRMRRSARRTGRTRTSTRRARKRSARSRSIRRRPTRSSCWRGSKGANVLKSRWLWRNRSRTTAFTKSS